MATNRGKRKRRTRRRYDADYQRPEPAPVTASTKTSSRPRRQPKPLAERSPLVPGAISVFCVLGAVFMFLVYRPINKVAEKVNGHVVHSHGHIVYKSVVGGPTTIDVGIGVFYLLLAGVEAFILLRILRARREAETGD